MIAPILITMTLIVMMCVLAYRLATYALPLMLALEATRSAMTQERDGSEPEQSACSPVSRHLVFSRSCSPHCVFRSCASAWL